MVKPPFMLAWESSEFRRYIRAFSLMLAEVMFYLGGGQAGFGESDDRIAALLRRALPQLDPEGLRDT